MSLTLRQAAVKTLIWPFDQSAVWKTQTGKPHVGETPACVHEPDFRPMPHA